MWIQKIWSQHKIMREIYNTPAYKNQHHTHAYVYTFVYVFVCMYGLMKYTAQICFTIERPLLSENDINRFIIDTKAYFW